MNLNVSVKYEFYIVLYVIFLENIFIYFNKNMEPFNEIYSP